MRAEKLDTRIRKEQIAQAALDLISSRGLRGVNIAGVARRVGVVPSAIYRHFRNKDEMINAVFDLLRERLEANVKAAHERTEDGWEQLHLILRLHVTLIRENRAIPRVIFSEDVIAVPGDRRNRVYGIMAGYMGEIRRVLESLQKESRLRPDVDLETAAVLFLGLFQPAAILWHLSEGGFDITRHSERAWSLYRTALENCGTPSGEGRA